MSILLDPADGPRRAEYTEREMRLMEERDAALTKMEAWRDDARRNSESAGVALAEQARLRACLDASEECVAKLEDKLRALQRHPCDRAEVRVVVFRLAELVRDFYSAPGGPDEPNPDEFTARRDALVGRLESVFARKDP